MTEVLPNKAYALKGVRLIVGIHIHVVTIVFAVCLGYETAYPYIYTKYIYMFLSVWVRQRNSFTYIAMWLS